MEKTSHDAHHAYLLAGPADNAELLELLRKNPIRMEMDYVMDRCNNFFGLHPWLPGSRVLLARDHAQGKVQGFVSLIRWQGRLNGAIQPYQYITDLVKSTENRQPMMMKRLLNVGLQQYFDTPFIFGLVNVRNHAARLFSSSAALQYPGQRVRRFFYYEIAPIRQQRIASRYRFKSAQNHSDLQLACTLINAHYKDHALYLPMTPELLQQQFDTLPGFSQADIVLLFDHDQPCGAMITYRPALLNSLIITRMDRSSRLLFGLVRWVHRVSGLLFDPPAEGDHIRTLQLRYLAGDAAARGALLQVANNMAYAEKLHSISMMLDEKDPLRPHNWIVYRYESIMFANGKDDFQKILQDLEQRLISFDIALG